MRALTLIAPMGQAIVMDHPLAKRIENRPRSLPRKMLGCETVVAVHSGKKWSDAYAAAAHTITGTTFAANPGEIIGLMRLTGRQFTSFNDAQHAYPNELARWYSGPYGYEIADAVSLQRPIKWPGMMG